MEIESRTIILSTPEELLPLITEAVRSAKIESSETSSDIPTQNKKLLAPKDVEKEFGIQENSRLLASGRHWPGIYELRQARLL